MSFGLAVTNAFLYLVTCLVYWRRHKKMDICFFVLLVWATVAVLCSVNVYFNPNQWDLTLFPFIYLYVVFMIYISPYFGFQIKEETIQIPETSIIRVLAFIFVVSGFFSIYFTLPDTIELFRSGEWGDLRNQLYADRSSIDLYHSTFERLMKNVHSYLNPFGAIISFYQLTKIKYNKFYTFILFVSWVVPSFLSATLIASRGMLAYFMIEVAVFYFLFKKFIPKKRKRFFWRGAIVVAAFFISYLITVSVSRFDDEAGSSIFNYLGQSMLYFNDGVMNGLHTFANGRSFFEWFYNILGIDASIDIYSMGGRWGSSFITFIGMFYLDFGPVGTFIMAIIVARILKLFTSKKSVKFCDLTVLAYFAHFFANGVFVVGRSTGLQWIMVFVVYVIVKSAENGIRVK